MPEFVNMPDTLPSPSCCFTCGSHEPPMRYLRENYDGLAVLLCPLCIVALGQTQGMITAEEHEALEAKLSLMRMELEDSESQLQIERSSQIKVVSLSEVRSMLDEAAPDAPEPRRRRIGAKA